MTDNDRDYASIDRRLSFEHQRYNTEYMRFLERKVNFHEKMVAGLILVMLMFTVVIVHDDFRIRRLDETTVKKSLAQI